MDCRTCGQEVDQVLRACRRCLTPAGQPAVRPDVPVYDLVGVGRLATVAVVVATASFVAFGVGALAATTVGVFVAPVGDVTLAPVAHLAVWVLLGLSATTLVAAVAPVATWLGRARKNLDAFPGTKPTMRAGWAVAGWFIPVVNLVVPARVMANVVRESLRSRQDLTYTDPGRRRSHSLVNRWHGLVLLSCMCVAILLMLVTAAHPTGESGLVGPTETLCLYVLLVPPVAATLVLCRLIRTVTAAQAARLARGGRVGGDVTPHPVVDIRPW